jgi:hypothetical protein
VCSSDLQIVEIIDSFTANISPPFPLSTVTSLSTFNVIDGEYGVFYSDPSLADGVSEVCNQQRLYETGTMDVADNSDDIRSKMRALPVISSVTDSISISRNYHKANSSRVGYYWTITFFRQNGNIKPLSCDTSILNGTNAAGASCVVTTVQDGSLISGDYTLGMTYPHVSLRFTITYNILNTIKYFI